MRLDLDLQGHYWTIAPFLVHKLRPLPEEPSSAFSVLIDDPRVGVVRVRGRMRHRRGTDSLLVVVHGLGGDAGSHYVREAAAAAERAGLACLRLNLRGAGGDGRDFYHAGLYSDLHAALAAPDLARYERVFVVGYSLGGHIALRYAASGACDPRVRSVAAICPPIDLDQVAAALDRPERWVYRRHALQGLKALYATIAARRPLPLSVQEARAIRSLREWDGRVVAPRWGYRSAEHYYEQESVAPRLHAIAVRSLLLAAEADPMVPVDTIRSALRDPSPLLDVRWLPLGGHVGFPKTIDLGLGPMQGLEAQVIRWLTRAASPGEER